MREIKYVTVNGEWVTFDGFDKSFDTAKCFQGNNENIIKALVKRGYDESKIEIFTITVTAEMLIRDKKLTELVG